jgi:hypothetical protein
MTFESWSSLYALQFFMNDFESHTIEQIW